MSALQIWLQNHNRRLTQEAIDEALMEYITHIETELADALDCKLGIGPTALSMVIAQRDALKTELREISEAIDDPEINLTKTAVECINDLKLRIRLAEGCAARNQETTHICMNNIRALKEELDTARNGFIEWDAEHIKTGNIYRVVGEALDATNMSRGMHMVIYRREGKTFVREASEFMSKFRAAKGQA